MKNTNTTTTIKVTRLHNGSIILGQDGDRFHVRTEYGISVYTTEEMKEIYNYTV